MRYDRSALRGQRGDRKLPDETKGMATRPILPDAIAADMKSTFLSRRLAKEKVECPGCGKWLQIGTLAWSHHCKASKPPSDDAVQRRRDRMKAMAVKSFQRRMATQECAGPNCPTTEPAPMPAASSHAASVNGGAESGRGGEEACEE